MRQVKDLFVLIVCIIWLISEIILSMFSVDAALIGTYCWILFWIIVVIMQHFNLKFQRCLNTPLKVKRD